MPYILSLFTCGYMFSLKTRNTPLTFHPPPEWYLQRSVPIFVYKKFTLLEVLFRSVLQIYLFFKELGEYLKSIICEQAHGSPPG